MGVPASVRREHEGRDWSERVVSRLPLGQLQDGGPASQVQGQSYQGQSKSELSMF